jgi:chromosome segregation ATPase
MTEIENHTLRLFQELRQDIKNSHDDLSRQMTELTAKVNTTNQGLVSLKAEVHNIRLDITEIRGFMGNFAMSIDDLNGRVGKIEEHLGLHHPKH